jgi:hypothetical protein
MPPAKKTTLHAAVGDEDTRTTHETWLGQQDEAIFWQNNNKKRRLGIRCGSAIKKTDTNPVNDKKEDWA